MATNLLSQPSLERDLSALETSEYLPITSIISNDDIGHTEITKEKLIFCYQSVIQTLKAYRNGYYHQFDPLTATTCCHGMSIMVHRLIKEMASLNVRFFLLTLDRFIDLIKNSPFNASIAAFFANHRLPYSIIELTQIYLLTVTKVKDIRTDEWRTSPLKLQELGSLSSKLCKRIVRRLQTFFSNIIADSYSDYLGLLDLDNTLLNIPIQAWGKYVQSGFIRSDVHGRKYAPCLYSMQISLAHMIKNKTKIAIAHDLRSKNGELSERVVWLLEGDGRSNFNLLTPEEITRDNSIEQEPVIVFGGCAYSGYHDLQKIKRYMTPWLFRFPNLVLACDIFYPLFPTVRDDPNFNRTTIVPENKEIRSIIDQHRQVKGVSADNPSLYCLSHIYTASFSQIEKSYLGCKSSLPASYLPRRIRNIPQI